MTKEEAIEKLKQILESEKELYIDAEDMHIAADRVLCSLIETMIPDSKELLELYYSVPKWYA